MRYFFEIAYKGTRFHGWQRQNNATTVQETVEECLSVMLKTPVEIVASGRTDAGVHCKQQFFHTDLEELADNNNFIWKLNSFLPEDISIESIHEVPDEAHARFDAVSRSYEYHIHTGKSPFLNGLSSRYYKEPDLELMSTACEFLLGEQDFKSFSKTKTDVNTFICRIFEARWEQRDDNFVFHISANRFLRGMVRAIVGTMIDIGSGKFPPQNMKSIIAAKNRKAASSAAPAEGLYLTRVVYPSHILNNS